ncbi:MAG: elongation factor G, partial [Oscillospiraceae bacterium]
TSNIRNIALVGHGSSGKTSLLESMLFKSGATDRLGKIADGNTVSDYDPEEIKRKVSINTSLTNVIWKDVKINILDTPGLFDYAAGMYEGITACDTAVIVASGKSGITVGARKAFELASDLGKAKMLVIGKLDSKSADFYKVLDDAKEKFGGCITPLIVPYVEEEKITYIDIFNKKAYTFDENGSACECDIPADEADRITLFRNDLCEKVAETDDVFMEKFFSGEEFSTEEMFQGLRRGIASGAVMPVVCCSAIAVSGIDLLLDSIVNILPSPNEMPAAKAVKNGEEVEIVCDAGAPLAAFVFKTVADQFGKLSFIKILSGKLSANADVYNSTSEAVEKIGKLSAVQGKKQEDISEACAGDIVAAVKTSANTSDTLCSSDNQIKIAPISYPAPTYFMAVKTSGDESKISQGIHKLLDEDKTLSFNIDPETHEQIVGGLGDQHLDVMASKLKTKFGAEVTLTNPKIAYRETLRKKVTVEGKHKKQSGGHGQYGHVKIEFEPYDGTDVLFEEKVFGGSVPKNFFPAVEKGLQESALKGVLAGYPVVGLKATLIDGSYHPVDSSEMAFKTAASIAYKEGMKQASPCILEPIGNLKVIVGDDKTGDMMGELNKRRGRVNGMNPVKKGLTEIDADVPVSEMHDFTLYLRQLTQGLGTFTFEFSRYETVPSNIEATIIEKAK